ncbi:helix-turn-helix transcriptional regulator [Micromonospora sp. LH3U1]|uniref:helix-turn-helix transcriptional regulator n=1 Tax=Micromonospora sp. LH3U1 TaxID=3018339 RepID=UPI00234A3FDF|nr:DNA-binding response regulator [Micromonospora sp. LH3U1]WCN81792.1 DNA-binding response regulator [Micromonospora sp. LH3U1]
MSSRLRIAVSDPLPMFGRGIAQVMGDTDHDVEFPGDLFTWSGYAGQHLISLTLLGPSDWTLLATLRDSRPRTAVVAVIENGDVDLCVRALTSGAVGVMAREADAGTVRSVLSAAASGHSLLPADVVRALTSPPRSAQAGHVPTEIEISWIRLLAQGFTVARLAAHAGYSERMMFRVLRAIYGRWDVANRTEAIVHARGNGWI